MSDFWLRAVGGEECMYLISVVDGLSVYFIIFILYEKLIFWL
jgi:hypothetical protein